MGRPTTLEGWWKLVHDTVGQGSVSYMAYYIGCSTRTLARIANGEHKRPRAEHETKIRELVGNLANHPTAPKWIRPKKKKKQDA